MTDDKKTNETVPPAESSALDILSAASEELFNKYEDGSLEEDDAEAVYKKYGEIGELIKQLQAKNFHDSSTNLTNSTVIKTVTSDMQSELKILKQPGGSALTGKQYVDTADKIIALTKSLLALGKGS